MVRLKDFFLNQSTNQPINQSTKLFRFHIIGGCFQYPDNAEKLVKQLRSNGFNAAIVDKHKGLYRVCYQSLSTRNDALGLLAQVRNSSNNGAWLLVK